MPKYWSWTQSKISAISEEVVRASVWLAPPLLPGAGQRYAHPARWAPVKQNCVMHTDAWSFYVELGEQDRSALSEVHAQVAAICDLRQEVNSGGFDSYFRYWGGNTARTALAALPTILGQVWADLLGDAMSLLGPDYPDDQRIREVRLDTPGVDETLDILDTKYHDLEAAVDADALVSAHLVSCT